MRVFPGRPFHGAFSIPGAAGCCALRGQLVVRTGIVQQESIMRKLLKRLGFSSMQNSMEATGIVTMLAFLVVGFYQMDVTYRSPPGTETPISLIVGWSLVVLLFVILQWQVSCLVEGNDQWPADPPTTAVELFMAQTYTHKDASGVERGTIPAFYVERLLRRGLVKGKNNPEAPDKRERRVIQVEVPTELMVRLPGTIHTTEIRLYFLPGDLLIPD